MNIEVFVSNHCLYQVPFLYFYFIFKDTVQQKITLFTVDLLSKVVIPLSYCIVSLDITDEVQI
jgi:hypothetical protein